MYTWYISRKNYCQLGDYMLPTDPHPLRTRTWKIHWKVAIFNSGYKIYKPTITILTNFQPKTPSRTTNTVQRRRCWKPSQPFFPPRATWDLTTFIPSGPAPERCKPWMNRHRNSPRWRWRMRGGGVSPKKVLLLMAEIRFPPTWDGAKTL